MSDSDNGTKGSFDSLVKHVAERDPSGKSASDPGAKLDAGKPRVDLMFKGFPRALLAVAEVTTHGAIKYSELGFLEVDKGESRYADAGSRHMLYRFIDGEIDSDLPVFHLAQKAWNALAELEFACKRMDYPKRSMSDVENEAK